MAGCGEPSEWWDNGGDVTHDTQGLGEGTRHILFGDYFATLTIGDAGDVFSGDSTFSYALERAVCSLHPAAREATVRFPAPNCFGGEVRIEGSTHCTLLKDDETVEISMEMRLYEGTSCDNDDLDGEATMGPFHWLPLGSDPSSDDFVELTVTNEKEGNPSDFGTLITSIENVQ